MSSIPEDLYREILLMLPVESLLACKCVCKNWYALITSSDFVNLHIHLTAQRNNPIIMLEGYDSIDSYVTLMYSVGYDSLASSVSEIENDVIEMDYPFKSLNYGVELLGTCNGVVLIWLSENEGDKDLLCLWNPATREYKEIPKVPIIKIEVSWEMRAFGYDHKTDDYKLAIGVKVPGSKDSTLVQVYSLSSNSWKDEQTVPYRFLLQQYSVHGVLVSGDLHWLTIDQDESLPYYNWILISLDISDESFKVMQLSKEVSENNDRMLLGVLEGCLCIVGSSDAIGVEQRFDVWEMLEYEVQESWTKRYVIAQESITSDPNFSKIVWSFKNGEILFLSYGKLVLYDPKNGNAKINNVSLSNAGNIYFESLVSLNSGTCVGAETTEDSIET